MAVEIIQGDNVAAMQELSRTLHRRFALAYLDPPFFTQQTWKTAEGEVAFEDKWPSLKEYVEAVATAVYWAKFLLIPEGSVVVHVDPETSHYLKVALDDLFGRDHFASEIVWRYRRWAAPMQNFHRMHDVLLRYVANPNVKPRWNQLYEPLSPKTIEAFGYAKEKAKRDATGRRVGSEPSDEITPGAPMSDVWEISIPGQAALERTGYPTQKPEALLERLILATTNEGDWILEPYLGAGTACAVAHRLGRHAVGIDASPVAIRYARERLAPLLAQQNLFQQGAT